MKKMKLLDFLTQILFILIIICAVTFFICTIPENRYTNFKICHWMKRILGWKIDDECDPEVLVNPDEDFQPFDSYCDESMKKSHTYDQNLYLKTLFPSYRVF